MPNLSSHPAHTIVGVGASAGGLNALERFFAAVSLPTHAAFLVVQHLSADHKSLMAELLGRRTVLEVRVAEDGALLERGVVYVMPQGRDVEMEGGRIRLHARQDTVVQHPIDRLFGSIARHAGIHGVAVVLSGAGSDGTRGALAVQAAGGLVFVQDPSTAAFDSMPLSAIRSGAADEVLPPEQIWAAIATGEEGEATRERGAERRLLLLLSRSHHLDFTLYRTGTLHRRADRRRRELSLPDLDAYAALVESDAQELDRFANDVLIGVSSFFRDPEVFEVLEAAVLPELLAASDGTLRAWSCACSTGQEPYSLAIAIAEVCRLTDRQVRAKIFATDASAAAIERAAIGSFGAETAQQMSPDRLERYFTATEHTYRIDRGLRQTVVFSIHDALHDPPFSRLDLVTCRNLLIYLRPAAQRDLLARLAGALKPGGILVLGKSETLGDLAEAFDVVDTGLRIFRRRPGRLRPDLLLGSTLRAGHPIRVAAMDEQRRLVSDAYRALAHLDSPASVIVDGSGRIVHTTGDVQEFFALPVGPTTLDVTSLGRGNVGTLLTVALATARRERKPLVYPDVELRLADDRVVRAFLRVAPFGDGVTAPCLISLRRLEETQTPASPPIVPLGAEAFEQLHQELRATRENLQSVVEELEAANEELQAANEELVASNEELQATNEELQATNEELATANAEGERRIFDLIELNADMDGLFASTQIGTLFLDETVSVRKFTAPVTAFVSLLDRDVGRPLVHLHHQLEGVSLAAIAEEVLATGRPNETSAHAGTRHLLVRSVPHTLRGRVRGVVMSFLDVTELEAARHRLDGVMNSLPEHIAVLDAHGVVVAVNDSWRRFAVENGGTAELGLGEDYAAISDAARHLLPEAGRVADGVRQVLAGALDDYTEQYRCDSPTQERHFLLHVRSLGPRQGAVASHVDVTSIALANVTLKQNELFYRAIFDEHQDPLVVLEPTTGTVLRLNAAAIRALPAPVVVGAQIWRALSPVGTSWQRVFEALKGGARIDDLQFKTANDRPTAPLRATLAATHVDGQRVVLIRLRGRGADEERAELAQRLTRAQKMEALGLLAGGVAHELNNVLSTIQSVVFVARNEPGLAEGLATDLDAVLAATRRGSDLTRNLLGFARSGSVARERFDVRDVAREVVGLLRRSGGSHIELEVAPSSTFVLADRSQVGQALMNLCVNAIDAIRGRGHILVGVGPTTLAGGAAGVLVRVTDDGVGMDAETLERAFEPFFTTKPRGEGTGLGLSMVYGVAKSHGGTVEHRSAVGDGTTVFLSLPAAPDASPVDVPRAHIQGEGERVLVVDDDDLVRRSIVRLLARLGFAAEEAPDGLTALARAEVEPPIAAVLLDVSMPEMDGLEALRRLRATHPRLPVLLHSGYPEHLGGTNLVLDARTSFLAKPADPEVLTRTIKELIDANHAPLV